MVSFGPAQSRDKSRQVMGATATCLTPRESTGDDPALMLLAVVTIVAGFIPFGHFISSNGEAYNIHLDWSVAGTSIAVAVVSIAIATYIYAGSRQPVADTLAHRFKGLWTAAYHRFYLDEVYQFITHRIIFGCICHPIAWWDRHVVDGFFNFLAWGLKLPVKRYAACKADASSNIHLYSCWARWH